MKFTFWVAALVMLGACADDPPSAEEAAAKTAAIEQSQIVPLLPVQPEPFSAGELEQGRMEGTGCQFREGGSRGGTVAFAGPATGHLKLDGVVERFAPDRGSRARLGELPGKYDGTRASFTLGADGDVSEGTEVPGRLLVQDGRDRVIYQAQGTVRCR